MPEFFGLFIVALVVILLLGGLAFVLGFGGAFIAALLSVFMPRKK